MATWRTQLDAVVRPRGHVFQGWYIALAGSVLNALNGALLMQSYGAYFVLLQSDFGWSKTSLSGAFAMARVESGILGPLQGWLTDRFGPRAILRVGVALFALGFVLFSRVETLLGFYGAFLVLALGSSLGGFVTFAVPLVHWFLRHRTKAVALSQVGFAVGGLLVPLVVLSLDAFGWRATAFASGVLTAVIGLPLVQLVHHRPADRGENPDGLPDPPSSATPPPPVEPDFTAREALRTPAFWLLSFGHASALLVVSAVMVHLVPHLTEGLGISLGLAGALVAFMTACQVAGQMSGGYLGDRFDKRALVVGCMLAHALALWLLAFATSVTSVLAFALLHGWAWGARGPQMVALRADYFGASSFGTIMGFSSLVVMLGMSTGPLLGGYLADVTGSFTAGFAVLGSGAGLGSIFFLLARPPRH